MVYFEEWRHIKGFEGVYLISNKGRLMSKRGKKWRLRSNVNSKGDYLAVILRHGDKKNILEYTDWCTKRLLEKYQKARSIIYIISTITNKIMSLII